MLAGMWSCCSVTISVKCKSISVRASCHVSCFAPHSLLHRLLYPYVHRYAPRKVQFVAHSTQPLVMEKRPASFDNIALANILRTKRLGKTNPSRYPGMAMYILEVALHHFDGSAGGDCCQKLVGRRLG